MYTITMFPVMFLQTKEYCYVSLPSREYAHNVDLLLEPPQDIFDV
jgi:hypothetical protein